MQKMSLTTRDKDPTYSKILTSTAYTEGHNIAAAIIHQELTFKFNLITYETEYYKYTPNNILENNKDKLYYD